MLEHPRDILDGPPNGPPDVSVDEERDDAGPTNGTNINREFKGVQLSTLRVRQPHWFRANVLCRLDKAGRASLSPQTRD